jgi:hypothetical protein
MDIIYRSVDGGYQWDELLAGDSFMISDFEVHGLNPDVIYVTGMENSMAVYKTENGGTSWTSYYFPEINVTGWFVTVDPTDYNITYAGGITNNAGNVEDVIVRTTNGGGDWTEIWRDSVKAYVGGITVDSTAHNRIYAGTSEGVYISTDFGDNWTAPVDTIPADIGIIIDRDSSNILYTGGDYRLYFSTDSGVQWDSIDDDLEFKGAMNLGLDPENRYLYIGTGGGGIFRGERIQTGISGADDPRLPVAFELYQNYPNPFNIATVIPYRLPSASDVRLEVFNLMGRKVVTLIDGFQQPGNKNVVWNADGHASGLYFYRLTINGHRATRSMILLK